MAIDGLATQKVMRYFLIETKDNERYEAFPLGQIHQTIDQVK
jgi:hypothetical protein